MPRGYCLSISLVVYTDDFRINDEFCIMIKYADDTAIESVCYDDKVDHYFDHVTRFEEWCEKNFLDLNVKKKQGNDN